MVAVNDISSICCDLDGTLLDSKKYIGDLSLTQIARLKRLGKRIVLVSGRHYKEIAPYVMQLKLTDRDYVISCDGQYVHYIDGKVIWKNDFLTRRDIKYVLSCVEKYDNIQLITERCDYVFSSSFRKVFGTIRHRNRTRYILQQSIFLPNKIEKIICYEDLIPKEIECLKSNEQLNIVHYETENKYDILPAKVNKYVAIRELFCLINEDLSQSLYFGDAINDIECFKHLSHTIAVENASKEIKRLAKYGTKSNDEDGVGMWLQNIE